MLTEMKKRIVASLENAKESGALTAAKIRSTMEAAASDATEATSSGATSLRDASREAVTAAVETLRKVGQASQENIMAAVEGFVGGVRSVQGRTLETAHLTIDQLAAWPADKKAVLVHGVRQALQGARDVAADVPGEISTYLETAVTDVRRKNAELLGLIRGAVEHAVGQAIEAGTQLEETIVHVTRDATEKALAEGPLIPKRVVHVTETVLSGAVEAAERAGTNVAEVSRAAAAGVREGLSRAVEKPGSSLSAVGTRLKLDRIRSDVMAYSGLFADAVRKVAGRAGETAKITLTELADEVSKTAVSVSEKTHDATGKAAHAVADEAAELGSRMWTVAQKAVRGVRKGRKEPPHNNSEV